MFDTKLTVVRHAQGQGNLDGEFHGQFNSDLTELGIRQANCTAQYLKDTHFDAAFASDIARAYSTGKIIAALHDSLELQKNEGLREIYAGDWERKKFDFIQKEYPELHYNWKHNLSEFVCPGGESVKQLHDRVRNAFCDIVKHNAGKSILIASHATPIRCMLCDWLGLSLSEISRLGWVPNASVTVVEYDSQTFETQLLTNAYCDHLKSAGLVTELPKNI